MKKSSLVFPFTLAVLLALAVTACTPQAAPQNSIPPAAKTTAVRAAYTDPFAYCSAVGTIDAPDSSYTGVPMPDAIIQGYLKAAGLQNNVEPLDLLRKSTFWRCMDKAVYVCNIGANLPCDSKADTNKNPTQAMLDYCKANPDAEFLPMSVTGHATIYSWHCVKVTPGVLAQISQVDKAGFITNIWYKLSPNP